MQAADHVDVRLFIDGHWRDASDKHTRPVIDPASGQPIGQVACASDRDIDEAADSALAGFETWSETPAFDRAQIIRRAAALIRDRASLIGRQVTLEQGKPLTESVAEAAAAADLLEWFADEGMRVHGRVVPTRDAPDVQHQVLKVAVGPAAAFTPWNFPLTQIARKVGPALATGCSMIVKAPEETPSGPSELVRAFDDAGLPGGVLSLVFGEPAHVSDRLIAHRAVQKVSFTGSIAVGKLLAEKAGRHMKRATMELGGHAPVIVAEDADVDAAVRALVGAKFRNAGQVCIAPSRFFVHQRVKQRFAELMASAADSLVVGHGFDERTRMGPLANPRRLDAMRRLTEDAVGRGARVLAGGRRIGTIGCFWAPTVLLDVEPSAMVLNEEPFGPLVAIRGFDRLDEAIDEANRLPYGLAGYAFTRSMKTANLLTRRLGLGMLWINTTGRSPAELPFGGVKESGYGSEGGSEALLEYLSTRTVTIKAA